MEMCHAQLITHVKLAFRGDRFLIRLRQKKKHENCATDISNIGEMKKLSLDMNVYSSCFWMRRSFARTLNSYPHFSYKFIKIHNQVDNCNT